VVAQSRLVGQRAGQNRVEIAAQPAGEHSSFRQALRQRLFGPLLCRHCGTGAGFAAQTLAGQQFAEHDAQGVDVDRGRLRCRSELLGRGVLGCQ
jgi:hypothetical protein